MTSEESEGGALRELRNFVEGMKDLSTGETEEGFGKKVAYQTVLAEIDRLEGKAK